VPEVDVVPNVAVIVTDVVELTALVGTGIFTDFRPALMTTADGTVAADWLQVSAILSPPGGAGELIVIVAELAFPPTTVAGFSVTDTRDGGFIVKLADSVVPLRLAVMVDVLWARVASVLTVKVVLVLPPGT
jgi:hypothetical protein